MRRLLLATLLIPFALLGVACGDDDDTASTPSSQAGTATTETTAATDDDPFCAAAIEFANAQAGAPDAATPEEVQETVEAMTATADGLTEVAPEGVREDAAAFADAIRGLEDFAAAQDYDVDLGAAAPIYQSGEGQRVGAEIQTTIVPVDQAVQDTCDRFLTETD